VSSWGNNRVLRYGPTGAFETIYAQGNGLSGPTDLTFDSSDRLYVSSCSTAQVLRWDANGNFLDVFASDPRLGNPQGLAFDSNGRLYVGSGTRPPLSFDVLRFLAGGQFDKVFASGWYGRGVTIGPDTNIYISDAASGRVARFSSTTEAYDSLFAVAGGL